MTNKQFEETMKEIEKINKALDKLKFMLPRITDEEQREELLFVMDYLETKYKKLEIDFIIEERDRKI